MEDTKYHVGDRVYVCGDDWQGLFGEVIETRYDGEPDLYLVRIDDSDEEVVICEFDMEEEV